MEIINYNIIKEKVGNYALFDSKIKILEKIKPLCEIILRQYASLKNKEILSATPIDNNKAINIIANFYKSIDIDLYSSFLNVLYDKEITKIYNVSALSESCGSSLTLNLENNTNDIIKICHESIHQMFQPYFELDSYDKIYQTLYVELNPIIFERWLIESTNNEYGYFLHNRMINAKNHVLYLYFMEILKDAFLSKLDLNDEIIIKEINKVNDEFFRQVLLNAKNHFLIYIQRSSELSYIRISRYIIATSISASIFKRIKNNELSYQEYVKKMQELCTINTYSEGLDILNLNYMKNSNALQEIQDDYKNCYEEMMNQRKR